MAARIVMGLGFGDEGKGTVVDSLTANSPRKPLVIRFSGGAQAAHNVITEDGFHHTFSQFGSGTLRHASTFLSRYMLVDPVRIYFESIQLNEYLGRNSLELLAVDGRATLVTRIHQAINHARERARGDARHGSTGFGTGEAEFYRLSHPNSYPLMSDLANPPLLAHKLKLLYEWGEAQVGALTVTLDTVTQELQQLGEDKLFQIFNPSEVNELISNSEELIFEGSQGVLLDEWVGFHPHTTWSTLTPKNALAILKEAGVSETAERIGVIRTYTTRHGAGPFPSENNKLDRPELHNTYGEFQGFWRVGTLDLTLLAYAASVVRPTSLAITHMDIEQDHVATRYDEHFDFAANIRNAEDKTWQESFTHKLSQYKPTLTTVASNNEVKALIEKTVNAKASLLSYGPDSKAKVIFH